MLSMISTDSVDKPASRRYLLALLIFLSFSLDSHKAHLIHVRHGRYGHNGNQHQKCSGKSGTPGKKPRCDGRQNPERFRARSDRESAAIKRIAVRARKHLMAAVYLSPLAVSECLRAAWRGRASESFCFLGRGPSREAAGVSLRVPSALNVTYRYTLSASYRTPVFTSEYINALCYIHVPACSALAKGESDELLPPRRKERRGACTGIRTRVFRFVSRHYIPATDGSGPQAEKRDCREDRAGHREQWPLASVPDSPRASRITHTANGGGVPWRH